MSCSNRNSVTCEGVNMKHKNLKSERVRMDYTQAQFAEILGVSESALVRYEMSNEMPQKVLMKAADIFGCSIDYLMDRTEERIAR